MNFFCQIEMRNIRDFLAKYSALLYKLSVDLLTFLLGTLTLFLIAESILPSILTRFISFTVLAIGILFVMMFTAIFGRKIGEVFPPKDAGGRILGSLAFFFLILLGIVSLKFGTVNIIVILLLSLLILFSLKHELTEK